MESGVAVRKNPHSNKFKRLRATARHFGTLAGLPDVAYEIIERRKTVFVDGKQLNLLVPQIILGRSTKKIYREMKKQYGSVNT
jgi:hypothetical protein